MSYVGNVMIDWCLRGVAAPTPPANWIALITDKGEVVGGGYARVNISGQFSAPGVDDITSNLSRIDFPTPTSAWGTVTGVAIFDAETGGNQLLGGPLDTPLNIPASTPVYWNAGTLKLCVGVRQV